MVLPGTWWHDPIWRIFFDGVAQPPPIPHGSFQFWSVLFPQQDLCSTALLRLFWKDELRPAYVGLIISHYKDFPQKTGCCFCQGPNLIWNWHWLWTKTVFVCKNPLENGGWWCVFFKFFEWFLGGNPWKIVIPVVNPPCVQPPPSYIFNGFIFLGDTYDIRQPHKYIWNPSWPPIFEGQKGLQNKAQTWSKNKGAPASGSRYLIGKAEWCNPSFFTAPKFQQKNPRRCVST